MDMRNDSQDEEPQRAINIPDGVLGILLILVFLHVLTTLWLDAAASADLAINTLFFPARYAHPMDGQGGAYFWSFASYSLFHANWLHLGLNAFWLAAFGSLVERRIGIARLLVFWVAASVAGALAFLATAWGTNAILLGASGAIAGLMGAAVRFAFPEDRRFAREHAHLNPRQTITRTIANRGAFMFAAIYLGLNVVFPALVPDMGIAWEAHLGGFLFGFLLFAVFDRRL